MTPRGKRVLPEVYCRYASSFGPEGRMFPPSAECSAKARIKTKQEYQELWEKAQADPEKFWGELAKEETMTQEHPGKSQNSGQMAGHRGATPDPGPRRSTGSSKRSGAPGTA